jgi:hypothetical protein
MSRKGHYSGGSTIISPRDPSWFKKGSTRAPPSESAPRPPLSLAEKAAFEALKQSKEEGVRLIPKGEQKKRKSHFGKTKFATRKLSAIKAEPSLPQKGKAVTHQVLKKGRSREVAVEFVSDRKSSR